MTHRHVTSYILNLLISLCVAFFLFSACSFRISQKPDTAPTPVFGTVKVGISLDENFSWSSLSERSAMPSGFPTDDATKLVFAGAVHADGTTVTADMLNEGVYNYDSANKTSTVEIPFTILNTDRTTGYSITIYAFPHGTTLSSSTPISSALLVGKTAISIPASSSAVTLSDDAIKMYPNVDNTTAKGFVNLSVTIPSKYYLAADNSGLKLTRADSAVGDTITYTIENKESGGISASSPMVTFSLLQTDGVETWAVYAWSEAINIFPGLTTNKWDVNSIGTLSADGTTRIILEITISSTVYVRGSVESGQTSWFESFGSADGDDSGIGSLMHPFATVQKAVDKVFAMNGGAADEAYTIFVDGTVQNKNSNESVVADFSSFGNDKPKMVLSIIGLGAEKAVLQGKGTSVIYPNSVILISNSDTQLDLTLENLKIIGGAKNNGGGIHNGEKSKITIKDCEISGNQASGNGGGIYNNGTLVISGGEISGNSATTGGGIYNDENGTVKLSDGVITDNSATGDGNGIYNNGALEFSGGVKVDVSNDVHLPIDALAAGYTVGEKAIKITGDLTETAVATVTLDGYYNNAVVLFSDDENLIHKNISKIKLSNSDFALVQNDDNKKQAVTVSNELREVIYLHPSSGSDMKSGKDETLPVKTLSRACDLLDYSTANPKIVMMSSYTLEADDAGLLDFSGKVSTGKKIIIERYYKDASNFCTGYLITVPNNLFAQEKPLVLKNVVFDGNWKADGGSGTEREFDNSKPKAKKDLFYILEGNYVQIESDTVFKNNYSKTKAGAICNSGTLTINGGEISGNKSVESSGQNSGGIFNYGTLTVNDGSISNNETNYFGGGIFNISQGTLIITGGLILNNTSEYGGGGISNDGGLTITGGTISGNTANYRGNGIKNSSSSTFNLSGAVQIDDEIYLGNSSGDVPITITGNLTASTVGRITLEKYASDAQVLSAGTGVTITKDICKKFILNEEGDPSKASTQFAIIPNENKSAGILKKIEGNVTITLPGSYTFTLSGLTGGKVKRGNEISFSVKDSSGNAPSGAAYSISLKQNGTAFITVSGNKITVPSWLSAGHYDVLMKVQVNGKWYDDTKTIEVIE